MPVLVIDTVAEVGVLVIVSVGEVAVLVLDSVVEVGVVVPFLGLPVRHLRSGGGRGSACSCC